MMTWAALVLQDCASPLMEQLSFFHDHATVLIMVLYLLLLKVSVLTILLL